MKTGKLENDGHKNFNYVMEYPHMSIKEGESLNKASLGLALSL